jgi:hypothetical protein
VAGIRSGNQQEFLSGGGLAFHVRVRRVMGRLYRRLRCYLERRAPQGQKSNGSDGETIGTIS